MTTIFLLCIVAGFIQRTTGFGFGIFIMTMLPLLMPSYGEATTLSGLLALTTALLIAVRMHRLIDWCRLVPILLAFIVVSAVAVCCLARIDNGLLHKVLGVVLMLTALHFALFSRRLRLKPTRGVQIGAGVLSGLMGGLFAMQGPPAVLYFLSAEPDKHRYMATSSAYFLLGNTAMTLVRAGNGFLTAAVGHGYLYGLGGVAAGTWLGAYAFRHIPEQSFRYVVYAYIGLCGLYFSLT